MYKFNCSRCNLNLKDFNRNNKKIGSYFYYYYYCNCTEFSNSVTFSEDSISINIFIENFIWYILKLNNNMIVSVAKFNFIENTSPLNKFRRFFEGHFDAIYDREINLSLASNLKDLEIIDYFYSKFILNEIFI